MGIKGPVKDLIYKRYKDECIAVKFPQDTQVVTICMMQHLKMPLPFHITTLNDAVDRFCCRATNYLAPKDPTSKIHTVVVNFDLGSPGVKKIVAHSTRYKNKKMLKFEDGPHLNGKLPENWMEFALDTRNLRAELYPLIYNWFLKFVPGKLFHRVILNGVPINTISVPCNDKFGYMGRDKMTRKRLVDFDPQNLPKFSENDYHNTIEIVGMPSSEIHPLGYVQIQEMFHMQNDIHEADNSTFYFSKFFPEDNILVSMNDGDGILIGLLKVGEDILGPCQYSRQTYLQLPIRGGDKKKQERYGDKPWPKYDYINLTKLHSMIQSDKVFVERGVQNPVASLVYISILAGTDFVPKCFPGVGWSNVIYKTFITNLEKYSHMVQCYYFNRQNDPEKERQIVPDVNLFVEFGWDCYKTKHKKDSVKELKIKCSKLPTEDSFKVSCLNAAWNINYWGNAPYNKYVDPFEKYQGFPMWGYTETKIVEKIECSQKPVDEVFFHNFYGQKKHKIK